MQFQISMLAQDLEQIWLYTYEKWSLEQADRYINLMMDEIEYLAKNPEAGFDFGSVIEGYFRSIIKSHLIFYKINAKKQTIEVIRIVHQRMDIESHLSE